MEDIPEESRKAIDAELVAQSEIFLKKVTETDWKLTQFNFLVNAGGAVAILAFLGTDNAPAFSIYPLGIFCIGVIASGIEIRSLLSLYANFHKDVIKKRREFNEGNSGCKTVLEELKVSSSTKQINHWMGIIAQSASIIGILVGAAFFIFNHFAS